MHSNDSLPPINQSHIKHKLKYFLTLLGESMPEWAMHGLCNGYSFMMMRAELIGETHKYLKRLHTLSLSDEKEIETMAQLFKKYREHFQSSEGILNEKLRECKNSEKRAEIRNAHHADLLKKINAQMSMDDKLILEYAKELYYFISSLLFSYDPDTVKLKLDDRYAVQNDYVELLKVIPPDKLIQSDCKNDSDIPLKNVLSFDFNFTETELINTFEKAIKENDFVSIYYSQHIMYLTKKNGKYSLYDPNNKLGSQEFKTSEELVSKIKKLFFANIIGWVNTDYFPIGFRVYTKQNLSQQRPTVKELLHDIFEKRGINQNIDAVGWRKETSLYIAAKHGSTEIVKELLERKADPYKADELGGTPILLAAGNGRLDVLKVMDQFNVSFAKKNKDNIAPIHMAVTWGQMNVIQFLIEKKVDVNIQDDTGFTPVLFAAKEGYADVLELLVSQGAQLEVKSKNNWTPVFYAAQHGHADVLKILKKYGVDLNKPDDEGITPLSTAAHYGQVAAVKFLAQHDVDINIMDKKGRASLHRAASEGYANVVEALVELKADVNLENKEGMTPLLLATREDKAEVVKLLGKYVDRNKENKQGQTSLLMAAELGRESVMKVFMEQPSIDLNKENQEGMTAVHVAVQHGQERILTLLSECKSVNFNKKNKAGMTPFMIAAAKGHKEVISFFMKQRREEVMLSLLTMKNDRDIHTNVKTILLKEPKLLVDVFINFVKQLEDAEERKMWVTKVCNKENALGILLNTADNSLRSKLAGLFDSKKTTLITEIMKQLSPFLIKTTFSEIKIAI